MGVGDRHSKRATAEKAKAQSSIQRAHVVDDRELDDAFSAWDDDDAGAQKSGPAQATVSSSARTRVERKAGPPLPGPSAAPPAAIAQRASPQPQPQPQPQPRDVLVDPVLVDPVLVDPVAMRDIVISRARTLDDPLTTRVLAEIARSEAMTERGRRGPLPQRTRTHAEAVKVAPPKILSGARSEERTDAYPPDMIAVESPKPPSAHTSDEQIAPPRRPTRRGIGRDEPFRKK